MHRTGILSGLLLASCAAPLPRTAPTQASCVVSFDPADYPGAAMVGFDPEAGAGEPAFLPGDRLLLALGLHDGDEVERWLLEIEVIDALADGTRTSTWGGMDFESRRMLVRVTVADPDGRTLGQTTVGAPRDWLALGLRPCCELTEHIRGLPEADQPRAAMADMRTWIQGFVTLTGLLELVQNDEVLAGILWRVVRTPSLFSLLGGLGKVNLAVHTDFDALVEVDRPPHLPDTGKVWCLPADLVVNDEPALYGNLLVTSPRPPYALCAGIVGLQASHPSDPDLRFSYGLLAARRGRRR